MITAVISEIVKMLVSAISGWLKTKNIKTVVMLTVKKYLNIYYVLPAIHVSWVFIIMYLAESKFSANVALMGSDIPNIFALVGFLCFAINSLVSSLSLLSIYRNPNPSFKGDA